MPTIRPVPALRRVLALGALLAIACAAGPSGSAAAALAEFARGDWSVGALGGYALFAMSDVNRILDGIDETEGTRYEDLKDGWEGALDVRYAFREQVFIGLEGGYLTGRAEDKAGIGQPVETSGIPLQVIGGGAIGRPSEMALRIIVGVGVLLDGKIVAEGSERGSGTAFLTCLGGEFEYRLSRSVALTAQASARSAKVKTPGEPPKELLYDVDFSGGTFRIGLRGYFGNARADQ